MKHYTGSDLGQDFRTFFSQEQKRIKKTLTAMGCTDIQMSRQFYYYYGFFTAPSGQMYYFSISDVRHFNDGRMLYRTAKSYQDYTGGGNQYVDRDLLQSMKLN
jgi:hypothetical protein